MRGKRLKNKASLAIYAPCFFKARLLISSTPMRTFFYLTSSSTFTGFLTSLRLGVPLPYLFQDVHSLPSRSNLCTSFPNCSIYTTSSSIQNALVSSFPRYIYIFFLNRHSPNFPTGYSCFSLGPIHKT